MKLAISLSLLACIFAQEDDALRRQSRFCQNEMNKLIKLIPGVIKSNFCKANMDIAGLVTSDARKDKYICLRAKCCKIGVAADVCPDVKPKPEEPEEKPERPPPVTDSKFCFKEKKKWTIFLNKQDVDAKVFCGVDVSTIKFPDIRKRTAYCKMMAVCCKKPLDECMPEQEEEEEEENENKPNPVLDKGKCKRIVKGWYTFFKDKGIIMGPFCEIDIAAMKKKLGLQRGMTLCKNMANCCKNVTPDMCKPAEEEEEEGEEGENEEKPGKPILLDKKCRKMIGEFIRKVKVINNYKEFCAFDKFLVDKKLQQKLCFTQVKCCGVEKEDCMPPKEEVEEKPEEEKPEEENPGK